MNTPTYGLWLLFGVVLTPLYLMLAGWIFGRPRQLRMPVVGVGFLIGLTVVAWGGMALFALLLGALS
ncbi:MAG TPA: hypothetical protein VMS99_10805 [Acidimicrobiia bacterium]|nr:hypothetical protein [Acidimicrobiia bacterium]